MTAQFRKPGEITTGDGNGCRSEAAPSPEEQSKNDTPSQIMNQDKMKSEGISESSKANPELTPVKTSKAKHKNLRVVIAWMLWDRRESRLMFC